jgi:glutamate/tyrosine decarboxylase-like PLP-dependent enzyme
MANQSGSYGYTRDTGSLFDAVTALVKEYLTRYSDRSKKVIEFHTPEEISQLVDLTLPEQGLPDEDIIAQCKAVMKYSVQTGHPYCFNQLWSGGIDQVGLLGQLLTSSMHTLMYTFEMAPVFTVMEAEILQKARSIIGWTEGDGIFTPGGSIANLYGLMAARYHKYPETKERGIQHLPRLVVFASEQVWERNI